ncbi:MAG: hypothetical protein FD138_510 [Planctomycetota bacterium]|nr:MAG: hypothetical protein FD138_510 [Planctomycetota bacterium]
MRMAGWPNDGGRMRKSAAIGWLAIWLSLAMPVDGLNNSARADEPFRSPDDRPRVDPKQMEKLGIQIFESQRIKLFTDIEPEIAKTLPPLVDQAFVAWEEYFGKLPPAEDGSDWQINGYLMKDKSTFEKAGLLTANLLEQFHGRQIGYQFWMPEQSQDYYRRHLLLHEATHAYMLSVRNLKLPVSYLEGIAEHFGTHRLIDGKLQTRLMPSNRADFRGHGRLFLMNRDVRQRGIPELLEVLGYPNADFQTRNETYAWAWGATLFLDQHPRTRERFRKMAKSLTDPLAWRTLEQELKPDWPEIATEWTLFAADASEGFDFERMAIEFHDGQPLTKLQRTGVRADRGWQSSGILVEKGCRYELTATGQFTLAEKPKPWVSEADGITFRYHNRRPLGQLLATIQPLKKDEIAAREPMLDVKPLGNSSIFEAARSGTLYLRLNEHPGELADNRGSVAVEIREAK